MSVLLLEHSFDCRLVWLRIVTLEASLLGPVGCVGVGAYALLLTVIGVL